MKEERKTRDREKEGVTERDCLLCCPLVEVYCPVFQEPVVSSTATPTAQKCYYTKPGGTGPREDQR